LTFDEFLARVSERADELATKYYGESQLPCLFGAGENANFVVSKKLSKDGVSLTRWREAENLYRQALQKFMEEEYDGALEDVDAALKINSSRQEYEALKLAVVRLLASMGTIKELNETVESLKSELANRPPAQHGDAPQLMDAVRVGAAVAPFLLDGTKRDPAPAPAPGPASRPGSRPGRGPGSRPGSAPGRGPGPGVGSEGHSTLNFLRGAGGF
jgi:hypothetical protein